MFMKRGYVIGAAGAAMLIFLASRALGGEPVDSRFYEAYYLEHAEGDLTRATELYADVIRDGRGDRALESKAKVRLAALREELAASDFTRLMPANALAYVEITRPGDQLMKLLDQLGILSDGGLPPAEGGRHVAVSPALIREAMGIRGIAAAVTGFNPIKGVPSGVAVFHHGDMDVIRGLIETGLPMGAKLIEPIGGFPTYDVEGEALVTLTNRLVILSTERTQIRNVVRRLNGEDDSSLATSEAFAEYRKARGDSLAFFMVNAKPIMPLVKGVIAAEGGGHDMALADALMDLDSLQSLVGQIRVSDDGVALELALRMDEGHRSLVYNLMRTPAFSKDTLKCVPSGAAAFAVGALNEAPSRFGGGSATDSDAAQVVTLLDIGREVFANITSFSLFVLPADDGAAADSHMIPDVGLVLTVNDPSKSEALWTQMLGVASLASGVGAIEGETTTINGVAVRRFEFPEHVTVYYATVGQDVLIGGSQSAIGRSIDAKQGGRSVLDDDGFARRIAALSPSTTKGLFVHAGRCAEIARVYMPPGDAAEVSKLLDALSETVFSVSVEHSDQVLKFSTQVTGMPNISGVLAEVIDAEFRGQAMHRAVASARRGGDWDKASAVIDEALAGSPGDAKLLRAKFDVLAAGKKDRAGAIAVGDALFDVIADDANALNNFSWALLTEKQYTGDYAELALRLSTRSNELTGHKNWMFVDTLALAKFESGDVQAAIALEKKAIELSDGAGADGLQAALSRFEEASERQLAGGAT